MIQSDGDKQSSIRFSICTTGLKTMTIEQIAVKARGIGLQGVEIWRGHIEDYLNRGGTLGQLRVLLDSTQLQVPCISEYSYFTKGREAYQAELASLQYSAEWARALHCPRIRVFAGHVSSGKAAHDHWRMAAQGLQEARQICSVQGVSLAVEIHNNTLADTTDGLNRLLEPHEYEIELIYDGFNLCVDRLDPLPVLEHFYPLVSHVHFKDYHWNHEDWSKSIAVPVLQGDANHAAILGRLIALGYQGFISFEYFGSQALELTKQSLAELTEYMH
ncbi:sugar phosphate isomerase/epimerase family protein [Paenibacillus woosongensis]|uniref:sugar phosphate isomerase/epimerase family protein n=1 Tax=Paenibacillus woosongensis TaxID=307580 RepID=UPI0018C1D196|nr:sugar phosphate isomerase/epimerase family protein [Paenibacillus woosongensis]